MARKKERGNGDGDVWPRKNKEDHRLPRLVLSRDRQWTQETLHLRQEQERDARP